MLFVENYLPDCEDDIGNKFLKTNSILDYVYKNFDLSMLRNHVINFDDLLSGWASQYAKIKGILPLFSLVEYKNKYPELVTNFVYLRRNETVFCTVKDCGHYNFISGIILFELATQKRLNFEGTVMHSGEHNRIYGRSINLHTIGDVIDYFNIDTVIDRFLFEKLGFYQSSAGEDIFKHRRMSMNGKEVVAFSDMRLHQLGNAENEVDVFTIRKSWH